MKRLLAILLLNACGDEGRGTPPLPADRAPTLGEVRGARLGLTLSYDPATVPQPFWATWRGSAEATFAGPQLGLDTLPAALETVSGFEELDGGCLDGTLDGAWTIGAGTFSLTTTTDDPGAATLRLDGALAVVSRYERHGPGTGTPTVVSRIEGSGTWTVTPGAACGPDDFTGGTTGRWTAVQRRTAAATAAPGPRGPRARLLLIDPETGAVRAEVEGPAARVAELAGVAR